MRGMGEGVTGGFHDISIVAWEMGFTTRADIHSRGGPGSGPIGGLFEGLVSRARYPLLLSTTLTAAVFGSPSADFMIGLNSPGFQQTLQQLMVEDTSYRPGFDGSQVQVQMDLNEPASAPSHLFTAYAGTPASAYMHDAHVMDPYPIPPQGPEDLPADDAAGDEGVAPVGRGRRVSRRRGCGTGGTCSVHCTGYGLLCR
ncbi:hypothetical protein PIB30_101554 [Stylosanthes scabra]|uniref:Uncharacterized protein n=1 Tax=Stylosanthes scabra TaxID=79078 RepID=A0ABU6V040_9FABA|nr:hypothetical protein [Stylosanthes scabra]